MDLWNRSVAAVTLVLAALLLGAIGLSALVGRYPGATRLAGSATDMPEPPSIKNPPRRTSNSRELLRTRQRAAMLEEELEKRNALVLDLSTQVEQLERQLAQLRREHVESIGFFTDIAGSEEPASSASPLANSEVALADAREAQPVPIEQQFELEELRTQLQGLQALLDAAQQQSEADLASLTARQEMLEQGATAAFVRVGPPGVPGLIAALESPRAEVRRWAAETLEAMGPDAQAALTALALTRDDPDEAVRRAVESALRTIPN